MTRSRGANAFPIFVLLASFSLNYSPVAHAARITDVADAMDEGDPFDANIELQYDLRQHTATITRENYQNDLSANPPTNRVMRVKELAYQGTIHEIMPRLEIGLFRDLGLFLKIPIIMSWNQKTQFADGTTTSNSTLAKDRNTENPTLVDGWPSQNFGYPQNIAYNDWRFDPATGAFSSERAGPNNPTFGLRWSPTNNERSPSSVTTTIELSYTAPFFPFMNPWEEIETSTGGIGNVANGAHVVNFSVSMSKRFGAIDPYFMMQYHGPIASSSAMQGFHGQHLGGFRTGMELIASEDPEYSQKLAFDLFAGALYMSEGRNYSELSDLMNDLTYVEQYMRTETGIGLYFRAGPFVHLDVDFAFTYDTDHMMTAEDIGEDKNNNGFVDLDDPQGVETNVYYNPLLDTPGRRLYVEDSIGWELMIHGGLTF
jgi:hypothetical protein